MRKSKKLIKLTNIDREESKEESFNRFQFDPAVSKRAVSPHLDTSFFKVFGQDTSLSWEFKKNGDKLRKELFL